MPSSSRLKTSIPEFPARNEYAVIALEAMFEIAHLLKPFEFTPGQDKPRHSNTIRLAALTQISGESLGAGERAFAFPLVVFAQLGLVFFDLGFEFAEGFLATGSHGGPGAGGVQRSGWQR
jgi:hypothetical protein